MSVTLYETESDPRTDIAILENSKDGPFLKLLCQYWDKEMRSLEDSIFDTNTCSEKRELLVQARKHLKENFDPRKLVQNGMSRLRAEINRSKKE